VVHRSVVIVSDDPNFKILPYGQIRMVFARSRAQLVKVTPAEVPIGCPKIPLLEENFGKQPALVRRASSKKLAQTVSCSASLNKFLAKAMTGRVVVPGASGNVASQSGRREYPRFYSLLDGVDGDSSSRREVSHVGYVTIVSHRKRGGWERADTFLMLSRRSDSVPLVWIAGEAWGIFNAAVQLLLPADPGPLPKARTTISLFLLCWSWQS